MQNIPFEWRGVARSAKRLNTVVCVHSTDTLIRILFFSAATVKEELCFDNLFDVLALVKQKTFRKTSRI